MRLVPALLVCSLAVAPLCFAMESAPTQEEIPLSFQDLKVRGISWKLPVEEYAKDAALEWVGIDGNDLFLLDTNNTLHCIELLRGVHRWVLDLPGKPTQEMGIAASRIGVVINDRLVLAKRSNGARYLDKSLKIFPATPPAVTEDSAYMGVFIGDRLHSVDGQTGIVGWSYRFRDLVLTAPAVYGEGSERFLYAAAGDGAVLCIAAQPALQGAPAKPQWVFQARGPTTAKLVFSGNLLYLASEDTSLYALNRLTGGIVWKYYAGVPLKKAVQIFGDDLYLKTRRDFLCFNSATGKKMWSFPKGNDVVALIKGVVYILTDDGSLAMVDAESGKLLKELKLPDGVSLIPNTSAEILVVQVGSILYGLK